MVSLTTESPVAEYDRPDSGAEETPTLRRLARLHLNGADGNIEIACRSLHAELAEDDDLLSSIIDEAVEAASLYDARMCQQDDRRSIINGALAQLRAASASTTGKEQTEALKRFMQRAVLDFPLFDGTKLRDAKREQVLESAEFYGKIAATNAQREKWLRSIAKITPAGKRVGDVVSEDKARALLQQSTEIVEAKKAKVK